MIRFFVLCAAVATFAACNDWTEMETVDSKVEKPWEQDPALWAEYTAALRAYKQSELSILPPPFQFCPHHPLISGRLNEKRLLLFDEINKS